ncbi:channel hemolysin iii family [Nannochloropsis gaditana CCMP526]|uniref:channel hemolysin iii family n=1 Tax=Nannochloropsis gaditana (strain CCMP526) TaxID=1093141 RepID=UPI00029F7EF9|nr:channel hemolysin iii family [Nannochloropsis gaditana CCMP526]EKU20662.1 channel hemolysin iii family [Nannochloropsis gaditana CCMP526]|eukprot:XP_005855695.1 channel hemolysin iii family [Nannochloropsis gaditana CCMP526]
MREFAFLSLVSPYVLPYASVHIQRMCKSDIKGSSQPPLPASHSLPPPPAETPHSVHGATDQTPSTPLQEEKDLSTRVDTDKTMPSLTSSRDPRQAKVPSYAGAFPSDPNEIVRLRSLYPPYSDTELDEAKKGQLIPGEVLYCEEHLAASLFALCCLCLFLSSWAYHRVHWTPRWEVWMQKLDHCMIFIMVSGNVAPLSLLALQQTRLYVLAGSALVATWGMIQIFRLQKKLIYFVLTASVMGFGLHELGWPRLWPRHFSSHELMHALTISAAGTAAVVTYSLLDRFDVGRCLWAA